MEKKDAAKIVSVTKLIALTFTMFNVTADEADVIVNAIKKCVPQKRDAEKNRKDILDVLNRVKKQNSEHN